MKRTLKGLALALVVLANPAFSAEVSLYTLQTGIQTLPMPEPIRVPGNLNLVLKPKETVAVPSPFDVSLGLFDVCVSAERDAPELTLAMPDYASLQSTNTEALLSEQIVSEQIASKQGCHSVEINSNPNQIGKIVTLLLAPE
jgi:hypothetical protein